MRYILSILIFLSVHLVHAQTCTGGLGDPIIDINFGTGPNFGPALANGITNLTYIANECPEDGFYTIASSENGCFGGNWLNLTSDHTGNPNGYFMLINASYQPSQFFVQTVNGLCAGTTYQFAAWVLNMAAVTGEILPNITFSITSTDGTVLDSVQTGNIPVTNPAKWNQYGFYFTTPPGVTTVILRMNNNAPGGNGNDLALDDITFRAAGPAMEVAINGQNLDSLTLCTGSTQALQFSASVENCYSSTAYQWQESTDNAATWNNIPGAVSQTYSALPGQAGVDLYRITAAQSGNIGLSSCQVASPYVTVDILKIPSPSITIADSSADICAGSPATFNALATDGGAHPSYQWLLNGIGLPTSGAIYTGHTFSNGDKVSCILTSDAACVINPIAQSNILTLHVIPIPVSGVQVTASALTLCSGNMVSFTAVPSNGGDHPNYQWLLNNNPVGLDSSIYSSAGLQQGDTVNAIMTDSLKCSVPVSSNSIIMTVYPTPSIAMTPDTVIAANTSIRLQPLITGQISSWQWSPAAGLENPSSPDPIVSPSITTTYQLVVSTSEGCTDTAKEIVSVYDGFFMPNAFTPNGDGRNDLFRIPPYVPVTILKFSIYNRQGELIFSSNSSNAGWDGRFGNQLQPSGTYVWVVDYIDPLSQKPVRRDGTVVLLR